MSENPLDITCPICHAPKDTMCGAIRWEASEEGYYPVAEQRTEVHPKRIKRLQRAAKHEESQ